MHLVFLILAFSTNFCLVTLFDLFDRKLTFFGIFNRLLSTQNVNVARSARNVEWDFFCNFKTPWFRQIESFYENWFNDIVLKYKKARLVLFRFIQLQANDVLLL